MTSIFEKYPYLNNLRSLVPDEIIETEIGAKANAFDIDIERARTSIPTVNLNKVFSPALEKGSITLENFLGHWGNVSIEELCKICLIVKFIKPKRILEIGTYNGMTTLQMALNAPYDCITYTLDLPEQVMPSIAISKIDTLVSQHFKMKFDTSTGSYFRDRTDVKIVQKLGDSSTFDYSQLGSEQMDLIFIDAAHDYGNKKIDSENAFKLLNPGGVIIWHNYNDVSSPDVTKYLADIADRYKLYHLRNTMLVVYQNNN